MVEELLPQLDGGDQIPYDYLVEETYGFSGSDIRILCKEAAMQPLRRLLSQLEQRHEAVPEEGMKSTKFSINVIISYDLSTL